MRKALATIALILVVCTGIGAATIEQAHLVLDTNASVSAASKVLLAKSGDDLLITYQASDSAIYLGRLTDQGWESARLSISGSPILQAFTAEGSVIIIGYKEGAAIYTISSTDTGRSFGTPTLIAPASHRADIHDIAIDSQGKAHLIFHRHDRFWDNNYSYSTDQGRTWVTRNAFTRATDSSSTGYNGSLKIVDSLLYTVYRDNNDGFRIKLALSEDGGSTWRVSRLAETRGALALSFAVDPTERNTLYVGAIDEVRLALYKVSGATTREPKATLIHEDRSITHSSTSSFTSIHLGVSIEGELAVIYRNPQAQAYDLLVSDDGGAHFDRVRLEVESTGNSWIWGGRSEDMGG
jgi:hypothetical protein